MQIKKVKSQYKGIDSIILYTENLKDDYLYNHQLDLVTDFDDDDDMIFLRSYDTLPDETLVSSRYCFVKVILIKRGF